ncbi:MAG: helix-turn-helix domain-containing protein, partial [Candidatus Freyarchaeota archaeon]
PSVIKTEGEGPGLVLSLVVGRLMRSLNLEEKLQDICSEMKENEEELQRFMRTLFGDINLRYALELMITGLLEDAGEGEEETTVGNALEEIVRYSRTLLEKAGELLLNRKITQLSDWEACKIVDAAIEKYTSDAEMVEAVIEEYNEAVLEHVVKSQVGEVRKQSSTKVDILLEAIKRAKQLIKTKALTCLEEDNENALSVFNLESCISVPYSERKRMTRYDYYRICDALKLRPLNKCVTRVDLLRTLLNMHRTLVREKTAVGTHLSGKNLEKVLSGELRYYETIEAEALKIFNSVDEKLKHLKNVIDPEDLKYTLELFVTNQLAIPFSVLGKEETEKTVKEVKREVKKYKKHLEKAVELILNKQHKTTGFRIERLSDEEVRLILNAAIDREKQRQSQSSIKKMKPNKLGKQGYLTQLAKEVNIPIRTLRNYIDKPYSKRDKMTRETFLKLCDVLNLPQNIRQSKRVSREELLQSLLIAIKEKEIEQSHSEENIKFAREELVWLPWFEQPTGTYCIFLKRDLQKVFQKALKRWGKITKMTKRMQELGAKNINSNKVGRIPTAFKLDVEQLLALKGYVIDRHIDDERKLAREGELARVFKSSLESQGLVDEEDSEWLSNLSEEVVREVSLESLGKETLGENAAQEETITPRTAQKLLKQLEEQELIHTGFTVNLPEEVLRELRDAINRMKSSEERILTSEDFRRLREEKGLSRRELAKRAGVSQPTIKNIEEGLNVPKLETQIKILKALKEEGDEKIEPRKEEDLYAYAAGKVREHTGEKISCENIRKALDIRDHRIRMRHYLLLCEVFGMKPIISLHYREDRSCARLSSIGLKRRRLSQVDFPMPVVYKHPSGRTVEIHEGKKVIFVVDNGRWLKVVKKKKTRYGGEWWGLTVIDYETEEGVYTVVKETGEMWQPLATPWYIVPMEFDIEFRTSETLKELIATIKEALPHLTLADLAKITGISAKKLSQLETSGMKTVLLGHLLILIALKSMLTQRDIKIEILKIEREIKKIEGNKLPKQRNKMLYINLKTEEGAALIGHTLGDGNLYYDNRGGGHIRFDYVNTEYTNVMEVSSILRNYGAKGAVKKGKKRSWDGKELKDMWKVSEGGLLAYALYRALPQAVGKKTKNNPKAPREVISDPILARPFVQALIKDETLVTTRKYLIVEMYVDVTKKLENKKQEIIALARGQLEELKREKGEELT